MNKQRIPDAAASLPGGEKIGQLYNRAMICLIFISIIPLFFKQSNLAFIVIDKITVAVFVADYFLRWAGYAVQVKKSGGGSALLYPFTFFAVIDFISILPSFIGINTGFKLLRLLRLSKSFRALKLLRYSKNFETILVVIRKERKPLLAVCLLAGTYVMISALVMFSVEPDTFQHFFDAFYWAVVTLTTVGYGDIYPVSTLGRLVSIISSFIGIAIIALPTGIITAGFMSELINDKEH